MAKLEFGILLMPSAPRGESFEHRVRECIDEAVAAEAAGFESCWIPEHHQDMGFLPQPLLVAAAVASRTSRIRIGTNIALIGLKHPMQVVEEYHCLDVISAGRAIAGVGLGYQEQDFSMFGRDLKARVSLYEDALNVMRLARDSEVISYQGKNCSITNVRIVPRPVNPGGVPILMGTLSSAGVRRVAKLGDGLLCGAIDDLEGIGELVRDYTELVSANGRTRSVTLNRFTAVGATYDEARALLEPHALKALRYYYRHRHEMGEALPASLRAAQEAGRTAADLTFGDFEQFFVCGTARDCIQRLEHLQRSLALDRIILQLRSAAGPSHAAVIDQIKRFGSDILPHFR